VPDNLDDLDMSGYDDTDDMGDMGDMGDGDPDGGGPGGSGETALGALKLDSLTFDKVVRSEGWTTLVKFDTHAHWNRDDEVEGHFKTLCGQAYEAPNFLVGEVQVQAGDDSPESNDDLRKRYQVSSDQFPAYLLFKEGPEKPIVYSGAKTATSLLTWLRGHGVKIAAVGTIAEIDAIIAQLSAGSNIEDRHIAEVQKLGENEFKGDKRVDVYVKIMKSIQSKGSQYVASETQRLQKVLQGQLSEEKRGQLGEKLNILSVFHPPAAKDEL